MNTITLNNLIELKNRFDYDSDRYPIIDTIADLIKSGRTNNLELCINILLKNKMFDIKQADVLLHSSALLTSEQFVSIAYPCYNSQYMDFITDKYIKKCDENIIKEYLNHPALLLLGNKKKNRRFYKNYKGCNKYKRGGYIHLRNDYITTVQEYEKCLEECKYILKKEYKESITRHPAIGKRISKLRPYVKHKYTKIKKLINNPSQKRMLLPQKFLINSIRYIGSYGYSIKIKE